MAALAAQGAKAIEAKDFGKAISLYTSAIAQHPTAVDYYIKRSTAYQRLEPPSNELALHDAEYAVSLAHKRGNKELIAQAQMRRGIALFRSGRAAEASKVFAFVRQRGGGWQKGDGKTEGDRYGRSGIKGVTGLETWEIKAKKAMEGKSDPSSEVLENPDVKAPSGKPEPLKSTVKASSNTETATATPLTQKATPTPASQIRHEWYQTSTDVVVTLFAKGVPKDRTSVDVQARSLSINFPILNSESSYDFHLEPLLFEIDPKASSTKILSTKLEISLKKAQVGQKWHALESADTGEAITSTSTTSTPLTKPAISDKPPSYPTSSKNGPKNWDTLIKTAPAKDTASTSLSTTPKDKDKADISKSTSLEKPRDEEEEDPTLLNEEDLDDDAAGDPANAFFRKLYRGADPDTRRAMMKSFQESNGTTLSTNWSDIGKEKTKTVPPEGMEAKSWDD